MIAIPRKCGLSYLKILPTVVIHLPCINARMLSFKIFDLLSVPVYAGILASVCVWRSENDIRLNSVFAHAGSGDGTEAIANKKQ